MCSLDSKFLTSKNFGLQEENINISKPQGKTNNYEKRDGVSQKEKRDRWTESERKREREDAVLYEKGG